MATCDRTHPGSATRSRETFCPRVWKRASKLVSAAKWRARQKGLECTIEVPWVAEKIENGNCEEIRVPFDLYPHPYLRRNPFSPSLSRRDHTQGYTPDNVKVTATAVNIMRNDMDEATMLLIAQQLLRVKKLID